MTLVARTVAADSRRFSQRPVILDGIIVFPSWTDQFSILRRSIRRLHATHLSQLPGMRGRRPRIDSNWMKQDRKTKGQEAFHV
jgi:hypothetical protein